MDLDAVADIHAGVEDAEVGTGTYIRSKHKYCKSLMTTICVHGGITPESNVLGSHWAPTFWSGHGAHAHVVAVAAFHNVERGAPGKSA